jgi:hypothetical protein
VFTVAGIGSRSWRAHQTITRRRAAIAYMHRAAGLEPPTQGEAAFLTQVPVLTHRASCSFWVSFKTEVEQRWLWQLEALCHPVAEQIGETASSGASFLETTASASVGPPHVSPIMQASLGSEAVAPGLPAWGRSRLQLWSPYLPPVGFRSAEDIGLDSTAPIARRKTSALSNSAAKRSHASAKFRKVALAEEVVACAARVRQPLPQGHQTSAFYPEYSQREGLDWI